MDIAINACLIACVVNIFGDLLFVAVFHWNVAGAALATVMAQAVSVILSIFIIRSGEQPFTMKWEYIRFSGEVVSFVKLGIPIAFQEILTQLSFLALCAFINSLYRTSADVLFHEHPAKRKPDYDWSGRAMCDCIWNRDQPHLFHSSESEQKAVSLPLKMAGITFAKRLQNSYNLFDPANPNAFGRYIP